MKHTNRRAPSRVVSLSFCLTLLLVPCCVPSAGTRITPEPQPATEVSIEPTEAIVNTSIPDTPVPDTPVPDTPIPDTPVPTEIDIVTALGLDVSRLDDSVWATTDDSQREVLLRIPDDVPHTLRGEGWVTVDGSGQALLTGGSCSAAYVYQNSGLTVSGCPRGGGTGMCSTGTLLLSGCDISVSTLSADVTVTGSWLSVTYLQHSQVTLVIVGEGSVVINPVVELDFRPLDLGDFIYEVDVREFGADLPSGEVSREAPVFLYTAGDDQLTELGLEVEPRTWLEPSALPPLIQALVQLDPQLGFWLDLVSDQAAEDGIQIPVPLTLVSFVDGKPVPNLALSWEVLEDGLGWRFTLNPEKQETEGAFYSVGLVAEILSMEKNGPLTITGFLGVEIIDDFTFDIYLEEPNPDFLVQVASIQFLP